MPEEALNKGLVTEITTEDKLIERAEEIVKLADEQGEREEETRKWVAQGKTVEDLLAEFGRI